MATITIGAGSKEGAYLGRDGTFPATLVSVTERGQGGLRSEGAPPFPSRPDEKTGRVGQPYYLREWAFAIEGAPPDSCMVWVASSAGSNGPKSKTFGIITALVGRQPPAGAQIDIERHLVGRMALLTVARNPDGFMDVLTVGAMPSSAAAAPAQAPEPVQAPAGALRAAVGGEDLPF